MGIFKYVTTPNSAIFNSVIPVYQVFQYINNY